MIHIHHHHREDNPNLSESRNGQHRIVELLKDAGEWENIKDTIWDELEDSILICNLLKLSDLEQRIAIFSLCADILTNTQLLIPAVYGWVKEADNG